MIIDRETEISVNSANIKHYENKGYYIPKYYNKRSNKYSFKRGTKIKVKTIDLTKSARVKIKVACDYCLEEKEMFYRDYNKSINCNEHIKKYSCQNCDHLKKQDIYDYKQSNGLLKFGDKGYWTFKENRLKELDNYIKKFGTITGMQSNNLGALISCCIKEYGDSLEECCVELGYDLKDVIKNYRPKDYYTDFDNLERDIKNLIIVLGRFPKQIEVLKNLHIGNDILLNFGGIGEIKSKMGYNDKNDLIDDRGFKNHSIYEYMTSQYLIENEIPYKREQYPFTGKNKRLRSDFTFYLQNGIEMHVEVWGYSQNDYNSKRSISYNEKRLLKEKLYRESNHILIGIDYEVFIGKYEDVQIRLYNIFNPYFKLKFKTVEQNKFIPCNKLNDKELLTEIMKYSDDPNQLPKQSILQENEVSNLFIEAVKRYGTYYNFAKRFGKDSPRKRFAWNKETVFNSFDYMVKKYGKILGSEDIKHTKDKNIIGIIDGSKQVFGSWIESKLSYYEFLVENKRKLSEMDLQYIDNAINVRKGFNRTYLTEDRINRFKYIKNNYNK